jgi:phytoene synthase
MECGSGVGQGKGPGRGAHLTLAEAGRGDTVRRIARSGDPDRALAALFAPREGRDDLLALYAFNIELARIAEQVSEPELGAIRLQWWREAMPRAAQGEATGHPGADALGEAQRRHGLSAGAIAGLIDARMFDIETKIMPDWPALEAYLGNTAGALFRLGAACFDAPASSLEQAASQAGLAYGLTGLMRALPVHAASGRVYLPADALLRRGTSPDAVLAGRTEAGLQAVLTELRARARDALGKARREVVKLSGPAQAAFLPLGLVEPYLAALERNDPLHHIAGINPLHRLWRLARWRP